MAHLPNDQRKIRCGYCEGNGTRKARGLISGELYEYECPDCGGKGVVCSLCWRTVVECECPSGEVVPARKKP